MDFAQKRRTEGRSASAAVEDIIALLKPIAAQQGVDLQGRLEEAAAQKEVERRELAERLQRAVMPLFKYHRGYPGTLGSCVLVRLDSTRNATKSAARQFCLPLWAEDRLTQHKRRDGCTPRDSSRPGWRVAQGAASGKWRESAGGRCWAWVLGNSGSGRIWRATTP